MNRFPLLPVEDEGRLHDLGLPENFIERVFVYRHWQDYVREDGSLGRLVSFHTRHKLLLMSHSLKHYTKLGNLVAGIKKVHKDELHAHYLGTLLEGLGVLATVKKNTNVLQHMDGYFKDKLSADEKKEPQDLIGNYHRALVPLIVPLTLLQHYVRKFDTGYLRDQVYLNPHPPRAHAAKPCVDQGLTQIFRSSFASISLIIAMYPSTSNFDLHPL